MAKEGLAVAAEATTSAPETMYVEVEQDENVARGCVRIKELIAYDFVKKVKGEDGRVLTDRAGNERIVENSRRPCFCQTPEQEAIFSENNSGPKVRIETFTIQLLKPTAIKFLNDPENMKQFRGAK